MNEFDPVGRIYLCSNTEERKASVMMKMVKGKKFLAILDNDRVLMSMFAGIVLCSIVIVALAVKAAFLLVS